MEELIKQRSQLLNELNQLIVYEWRMEAVKKALVEINLKINEHAAMKQAEEQKEATKGKKEAKEKKPAKKK